MNAAGDTGNDDEFYMVVPSNASPNSHPENTAADFIVDWHRAIALGGAGGNWKVAMTEMSYIYKPVTLTPDYEIEYRQVTPQKRNTKLLLAYNSEEQRFNFGITYISDAYKAKVGSSGLTFAVTPREKFFRIECVYPFHLKPLRKEDADMWIQLLGAKNNINDGGDAEWQGIIGNSFNSITGKWYYQGNVNFVTMMKKIKAAAAKEAEESKKKKNEPNKTSNHHRPMSFISISIGMRKIATISSSLKT